MHRAFAYKHDGVGSISSIVNACSSGISSSSSSSCCSNSSSSSSSSGMRRVLIVVVVVAASVMHSFIYCAL